MATPSQQATRWWVLFSNAFFLAAFIYLCWKAAQYQIQIVDGKAVRVYKYKNRILHAILTLFVGVTSFLYHLCDNEDSPGDDGFFHVCIIPFEWLNFADFTLSIATLIQALTYAPPHGHMWLRNYAIITVFLFTPFISRQDSSLYIFTGVLSFLILLTRWILRALRPDAIGCQCPLVNDHHTIWWFPFEGDWWFLLVSLVLAAGGLAAFVLDNYMLYWDLHPTWHAAEALALLFWFLWMDSLPDPRQTRSQSKQHLRLGSPSDSASYDDEDDYDNLVHTGERGEARDATPEDSRKYMYFKTRVI